MRDHGGACVCLRPVPAASKMGTTAQPTVVAAVRPRSINKLMCSSAHDSDMTMLLAADDASPASKVLYESLLEAEN